jgi:hypothetical protein
MRYYYDIMFVLECQLRVKIELYLANNNNNNNNVYTMNEEIFR